MHDNNRPLTWTVIRTRRRFQWPLSPRDRRSLNSLTLTRAQARGEIPCSLKNCANPECLHWFHCFNIITAPVSQTKAIIFRQNLRMNYKTKNQNWNRANANLIFLKIATRELEKLIFFRRSCLVIFICPLYVNQLTDGYLHNLHTIDVVEQGPQRIGVVDQQSPPRIGVVDLGWNVKKHTDSCNAPQPPGQMTTGRQARELIDSDAAARLGHSMSPRYAKLDLSGVVMGVISSFYLSLTLIN